MSANPVRQTKIVNINEKRAAYVVMTNVEVTRTILGTLGTTAYGVYAFLDTYCNSEKKAWPSEDTIADNVLLSVRQVRRILHELADAHWIEIAPRYNQFGFVIGNEYTLPHHATPSDKTPDIAGTSPGHGDVENVRQGNTKVTPKVNPRSGGRTRAAALPADFTLTDERLAYATGKGLSREMAALEFEKFIAYWREKGGTKKDWHAAWQRWVLNEVKWATERQAKQGGQNQGQRVTADLFATYGTSMGEDELNRRCADLLADAEDQP